MFVREYNKWKEVDWCTIQDKSSGLKGSITLQQKEQQVLGHHRFPWEQIQTWVDIELWMKKLLKHNKKLDELLTEIKRKEASCAERGRKVVAVSNKTFCSFSQFYTVLLKKVFRKKWYLLCLFIFLSFATMLQTYVAAYFIHMVFHLRFDNIIAFFLTI